MMVSTIIWKQTDVVACIIIFLCVHTTNSSQEISDANIRHFGPDTEKQDIITIVADFNTPYPVAVNTTQGYIFQFSHNRTKVCYY